MELKPIPTLPETGFLRLPQIVGDARAFPPVPALIPVSRSTWWAGVKSGRYPRPVKLGPRITAWLQIPDDPGHGFHVIPAGDSI